MTILNIGIATAKIYGVMKNRLRAKGKPIPENDIWIASIAKEHRLTVLTRDHHFQYIVDIKTEMLDPDQ